MPRFARRLGDADPDRRRDRCGSCTRRACSARTRRAVPPPPPRAGASRARSGWLVSQCSTPTASARGSHEHRLAEELRHRRVVARLRARGSQEPRRVEALVAAVHEPAAGGRDRDHADRGEAGGDLEARRCPAPGRRPGARPGVIARRPDQAAATVTPRRCGAMRTARSASRRTVSGLSGSSRCETRSEVPITSCPAGRGPRRSDTSPGSSAPAAISPSVRSAVSGPISDWSGQAACSIAYGGGARAPARSPGASLAWPPRPGRSRRCAGGSGRAARSRRSTRSVCDHPASVSSPGHAVPPATSTCFASQPSMNSDARARGRPRPSRSSRRAGRACSRPPRGSRPARSSASQGSACVSCSTAPVASAYSRARGTSASSAASMSSGRGCEVEGHRPGARAPRRSPPTRPAAR